MWMKKQCGTGMQTNLFFLMEQAGPLKQYDWGPSPRVRGLGFSRNLNSLQHHCQALALLIVEVRSPQNLYSSNYLPYLQY